MVCVVSGRESRSSRKTAGSRAAAAKKTVWLARQQRLTERVRARGNLVAVPDVHMMVVWIEQIGEKETRGPFAIRNSDARSESQMDLPKGLAGARLLRFVGYDASGRRGCQPTMLKTFGKSRYSKSSCHLSGSASNDGTHQGCARHVAPCPHTVFAAQEFFFDAICNEHTHRGYRHAVRPSLQ